MKYAAALAISITMRMMKIHTSNCTCTVGLDTPSKIKVISATPVTPYVSKPSALGPTEETAVSPVIGDRPQSLALPRYDQSELFTEREKRALDYAVAVMRTHAHDQALTRP